MKLITEVSEALEYVAEEGKDGTTNYKIPGPSPPSSPLPLPPLPSPLSFL